MAGARKGKGEGESRAGATREGRHRGSKNFFFSCIRLLFMFKGFHLTQSRMLTLMLMSQVRARIMSRIYMGSHYSEVAGFYFADSTVTTNLH